MVGSLLGENRHDLVETLVGGNALQAVQLAGNDVQVADPVGRGGLLERRLLGGSGGGGGGGGLKRDGHVVAVEVRVSRRGAIGR